ncbi:MAG: DUF1638 domain-containing protein [Rhizobiaceae bacterium]|nr:DUF1638 domain-containing protein [Rhizobiaceae bacterium]
MADTRTSKTPQKTRIIACGMIAREVIAINEQLDNDHIDLKCLPAEYHHFPAKIAPAIDVAITKAREEGYQNIIVGYADCGTCGELDKVCEKHGVERIEGPHCFSFYIGNDQFTRDGDAYITTFFITDFLARHFDSFLIKPLGLDKHPQLRDIYFGNYTRALYLAQTNNPELDAAAKAAAHYLGLEYERKFTGFGDLNDALANRIKS